VAREAARRDSEMLPVEFGREEIGRAKVRECLKQALPHVRGSDVLANVKERF